jgi:predicted O-methyltransferase YrrM
MYSDDKMKESSSFSKDTLIAHIQSCFRDAHANRSKISDEVKALPGMSGTKTRHFYNNLGSLRGVRYLEVGTWAGSSFISMLYKNTDTIKHAVVIDNWSEFGGPKEDFYKNAKAIIGEDGELPKNVTVIEHDCYTLTDDVKGAKKIKDIDIYLFDGPHTYEEHKNGVIKFWNKLRDRFILIVDDWNWSSVRNGTYDGIKQMGGRIVYQEEVFHQTEGKGEGHSAMSTAKTEFWNGISVFVIEKINVVF